MRFHVVGVPYTSTTDAYAASGFTSKIRNFCTMMTRHGHEVYLYGGPDNEAEVTEHIVCVSAAEQRQFAPDNLSVLDWDANRPEWLRFTAHVISEIGQRKRPRDFLCLIGGITNQAIAVAHPELMPVEFGIGYSAPFAPYRVWESYAWMHTVNAIGHSQPGNIRPQFFDQVIPGFFDETLFPPGRGGEGYVYMGRVVESKGYHIAERACQEMSAELTVIGHGDSPSYGKLRREVSIMERAELLGSAVAVFAPTLYVEPFGEVVAQSLLCGTPVITTPWGAFSETIKHGVNGFMCHTLQEFVSAARACAHLDREWIAADARARFSLEAAAPQYEAFFHRLELLYSGGWFEMSQQCNDEVRP